MIWVLFCHLLYNIYFFNINSMGSLSEEARALWEEQLDLMTPMELADKALDGRKKLEGIDDRLKDKIAE